jgi:hypothetical protein
MPEPESSECVHDFRIIDSQLVRGVGPIFHVICRTCGTRKELTGMAALHAAGVSQKTDTRA